MITGDDPYKATEKGESSVNAIIGAGLDKLNSVTALEDDELSRLLQLVANLNNAIVNADEPAAKPSTSNAVDLTNSDSPLLWQLGSQFSILNAFRDDAHVAAWRTKYDIPGHEWEAFSHVWAENVWGDPVNTAEAVAEKLGFRGYGVDDYTAVLQDCVTRGWLSEKDGTYAVTEAGNQMRQEAEETTDQLFYAPWASLRGSELLELNDLLSKFSQALQPEE